MFAASKHKAHATQEKILNERGQSHRRVRKVAQRSNGDGQDFAALLTDSLNRVVRQTEHHLRLLADALGHDLADLGETTTARIKANPVQSSLIALGASLLIAGIFYRR